MKVKDIMTRSLLSTQPGSTLRDASRLLLKHRLNSLPVVDKDDRLLGIITQADIFRAVLPDYDEIYKGNTYMNFEQIEEGAIEASQRKVEEVMTKSVITVKEDTPVVEAGSLLLLKKIKQLPVVAGDKLIGIVSFTDVIESLVISTPKQ